MENVHILNFDTYYTMTLQNFIYPSTGHKNDHCTICFPTIFIGVYFTGEKVLSWLFLCCLLAYLLFHSGSPKWNI